MRIRCVLHLMHYNGVNTKFINLNRWAMVFEAHTIVGRNALEIFYSLQFRVQMITHRPLCQASPPILSQCPCMWDFSIYFRCRCRFCLFVHRYIHIYFALCFCLQLSDTIEINIAFRQPTHRRHCISFHTFSFFFFAPFLRCAFL